MHCNSAHISSRVPWRLVILKSEAFVNRVPFCQTVLHIHTYSASLETFTSTMFWLATFLLLQCELFGAVSSGKVLAWPADTSHWLNLNIILEELVHKGHEVTVLVPSGSMKMDLKKDSLINAELFSVTYSKEQNEEVLNTFLSIWIYELSNASYWEIYVRLKEIMIDFQLLQKSTCDGVVKNKELLDKLKKGKFDVVVSDPLAICGELLAEILGVPFVYTFRFSMANSMERLCGHLPSPFSYVPGSMVELTDRMSFVERLKNTMFYLFQDVLVFRQFGKFWDGYFSESLGRPTSLCEVMGKAEIWLIRTYWDFEYPRPTLPNFEFVGGLHCTPAKPLPEVIWRYTGKRPDALGENTFMFEWIPQNDLLGHPKTKAFITHGGTNGIYEAIYHAVPMVGIPLFGDQPDNIVHMKTKGMAVMLDFNKMVTQDLVDAVNTVINNPTYKENALRISSIHHDQPIKPLDRAVFWIEFVMRHKGAKHLRPASHELTWYQYHCLDVIGFLLACMLTIIYIFVKVSTLCCRMCRRSRKKQKTQ
uniref:UDP-glucuronosyltransferase n=1 Tax=Leptobrachium leishanense TaxID=445787 RepID=A0A8C5M0E6_9ANUR